MTPSNQDHDAAFVSGYDRGRTDGIAQALAVLHIAIECYPQLIPDSAARLLPGDTGNKVRTLIQNFGDSTRRAGRKDEKDFLARKAKAAAGESK